MGDIAWYAVLIVAGFVAGIVNTIAGGGSFLTLPALMLFGLDPKIANGTNRIAILLQNIIGVASFKKQKVFKLNEGIWLAVPAGLGVAYLVMLAVKPAALARVRLFGPLFEAGVKGHLVAAAARLPSSDFKSSTTERLPRLKHTVMTETVSFAVPSPRDQSPSGGSSLMTSAPQAASIMPQ